MRKRDKILLHYNVVRWLRAFLASITSLHFFLNNFITLQDNFVHTNMPIKRHNSCNPENIPYFGRASLPERSAYMNIK